MNMSTKQKQSHRHREQTSGCQEGGGRGGEVNMQNAMYRTNKNKVLLHCTGNYIQYAWINHNRRVFFKCLNKIQLQNNKNFNCLNCH